MTYLTVACLFLVSLTAVVSQVAKGNKAQAVIIYEQRDGRMMRTLDQVIKEAQQVSHYPTGESASTSAVPTPKVKVIQTNALLQHLPKGTKLGELKAHMAEQMKKAYPWNPIIAESPNKISRSNIRSQKTIDAVINQALNKQGSQAAHYPIETGVYLTELDIKMTQEQYQYYVKGKRLILGDKHKGRVKRKALAQRFTYWPNGVIPYKVDSSFTPVETQELLQSIGNWMEKTCINFVPATPNDNDVLFIQNGKGCNSFVGRIGGEQTMNLQRECREPHVMTHELGHAIGLIHEHQRPDRDNYITVVSENVGPGRMRNFKLFGADRINLYGVAYDYTSIMHYGRAAFSKDGQSTTMITKNPAFQDIIGTSSMVSFKDAKVVNAMYNCAAKCVRKPYCGEGFVDKNCRCVCPDGTQRCAQRVWRTPSINTQRFPNTNQWQQTRTSNQLQNRLIPLITLAPRTMRGRPRTSFRGTSTVTGVSRSRNTPSAFLHRVSNVRNLPRAIFETRGRSRSGNPLIDALLRSITNGQSVRSDTISIANQYRRQNTPAPIVNNAFYPKYNLQSGTVLPRQYRYIPGYI